MSHIEEGTIHAWIDGALDAPRAAEVEAHVHDCAQCAAAVAEARGLVAASSRILSALDAVPAGVIPPAAVTPRRRRVRRAAPWVTGIAAALLVAVVLRTDDLPQTASRSVESSAPELAMDSGLARVAEASVAAEAQQSVAPAAPPSVVSGRARSERQARDERAAATGALAGAGTVANAPTLSADSRPAEQPAQLEKLAAPPSQAAMSAAAPAAPAPVASMGPERSALTDMRAARPTTPLRDTLPDHARLAGCYAVAAPQPLAAARRELAGQAARRAAQAPAAMSVASEAPARTIIRLDSLRGRPGYIVRAARSDSSLGWWMPVARDSARVDLLGAGVVSISRSMRVNCPEDER